MREHIRAHARARARARSAENRRDATAGRPAGRRRKGKRGKLVGLKNTCAYVCIRTAVQNGSIFGLVAARAPPSVRVNTRPETQQGRNKVPGSGTPKDRS